MIAPASASLADLHTILQVAMGWTNSHLHGFTTKSRRHYKMDTSPLGSDPMWDPADPRFAGMETDFSLRDVFDNLKEIFAYEYDFGDSWIHAIKLIATHADPSAFTHVPMCPAGERACPLEDSGGIPGYENMLAIRENHDPDDQWHLDVIEWLGNDFDPEQFDIAAVNKRLRGLRMRGVTKPPTRQPPGDRPRVRTPKQRKRTRR